MFYVGLLGSQRFANLHTRTLSSYWKAWNCFKSFHFHHKLQFPHIFYINEFSVISGPPSIILNNLPPYQRLPKITTQLFRLLLAPHLLINCLFSLCSGYQSENTAKLLHNLFILTDFGFLGCSEFTCNSKLNP